MPDVRSSLIAAASAVMLAACAASPAAGPAGPADFTPPPVLEENVRIPFAATGGVRSWRPLPDGSLLIEGRSGRFYRATFFGSCPDIDFSPAIGFINDVVGSLDRFSGVVVRDRVCRFRTLDQVVDPRAMEEPAATETPASPAAAK